MDGGEGGDDEWLGMVGVEGLNWGLCIYNRSFLCKPCNVL